METKEITPQGKKLKIMQLINILTIHKGYEIKYWKFENSKFEMRVMLTFENDNTQINWTSAFRNSKIYLEINNWEFGLKQFKL